ncbi:benzoate/toluate 1,2-dioxygenase reductase subunit [Spinactinospora alkalitolerans]|uniref:Benzoate/toluate 1,2-dioxygenase reductase subunit n=1 Tax=Spinactinospora alkalitolerans TaxID=687207 RepID=A0A852U151_9ACTN|nr:benzoate 1,2-dioxygenase electron transfer component BenC [Spinactinospora alkalitolerans]NYE47904.1 benzoate/toluate 1,2-dioxygenase reductase subunit [Spinactinospora alkalitolerans]
MSHQVALSFEDGVTRFIKCNPMETVADAAYRARINIPFDCRDGACGTCKAYCERGDFDGGDYIEDALTEDEAENGYCLPCQMTPESDLVLQIATTSDVAKTAAGSHTGTITEIRRHSGTAVGFTMEVDNRDELVFLPGQYVNITVPGIGATRSYSFSSGPSIRQVSFLVRITEGGLMSEYLRDRAQKGDRLEFTGPMGSFFLREQSRPALLLAGGTGLAPLLSILEKMRESPAEHPVHMIYGVSTDDDLVELEALDRYAAELPGFTYSYCVSDEASSAPDKGYVMSLMAPEHLNGGDVDVYLCGPPGMVEAVRQHLNAEGITPANFYFEKFNLAAAPTEGVRDVPPEPESEVTGESVAEAAGRAAEPAPYDIIVNHAQHAKDTMRAAIRKEGSR